MLGGEAIREKSVFRIEAGANEKDISLKLDDEEEIEDSDESDEETPEQKKDLQKEVERLIAQEKALDEEAVCHRILLKGENVDLADEMAFSFSKFKAKNKILNFIGVSEKMTEVKYKGLFEERYVYFMKDRLLEGEAETVRTVGNMYDLTKLIRLNQHVTD